MYRLDRQISQVWDSHCGMKLFDMSISSREAISNVLDHCYHSSQRYSDARDSFDLMMFERFGLAVGEVR